jgi:antitoxin (DNA-binding transcriptional repressor) of toxin-antitoxin stability system
LSSLIAKAEAGEEVIITRRGEPAVELRMVPRKPDPEKVQAAHEWLRKRRESRPGISTSAVDLLRLQDEDHRF